MLFGRIFGTKAYVQERIGYIASNPDISKETKEKLFIKVMDEYSPKMVATRVVTILVLLLFMLAAVPVYLIYIYAILFDVKTILENMIPLLDYSNKIFYWAVLPTLAYFIGSNMWVSFITRFSTK